MFSASAVMETLPERISGNEFPGAQQYVADYPDPPGKPPQRARFFSPITVTPSVYL